MTDENKPKPTGSARPAGKRQVVGVSTTSSDSYAAKKARESVAVSGDKDEKSGLVSRAGSFLPEVVQEMRKVIWPTAKQMFIYTIIVLIFLIVLTALVSGVDFLAGLGVEKVLTAN
ncbi:preprotein translocase subunit SecE [Corynebacterium sp. CCM 9185]|uniref:Protein translocase subunit SecE n=1 Tax=Corynebacterium marambiense TaxID=2765364 RepID=A0ABS0VRW5_9CORY|nr:preprotein translocase subunit SecE [Corynebacterium marambiense]MBI8999520.1 preprotein translocase subunit SecE [Corynebacterium marambiense]MCK7662358.1 preprotein translocase subunit SecE [Corynebacterium marambiense]MCX7541643.1 preprotein translocase subunit SecE [Corynebacterium marambiense]